MDLAVSRESSSEIMNWPSWGILFRTRDIQDRVNDNIVFERLLSLSVSLIFSIQLYTEDAHNGQLKKS